MSFISKLFIRPKISTSIPFNSIANSSKITSTNLLISKFSTSNSLLIKQKLKSHSGCKKRFFPNANGLFKRAQTGKSHLNTAFSTSRINRLAKQVYVTKTQGRKLKKMLPYA
uniref:50S ribosomal protein L35 n=1 Tax=Kwoniella pini CBS 10737 TaxID=1296096 RepID=A0A1B9IAZ3_9TREE|nr:ribosomal protein L35 [Kwoniella pini CBS 10737]OCF52815.1 ribosomal protein L35 [Kwoniella pini CBS 10737]